MPALAREFSQLILDADLPLDDESPEPLEAISTADLTIVADRAVDLLGVGWGHALVDLGVPRDAVGAPLRADDLTASEPFQRILRGELSIDSDAVDREVIALIQRAMMAIAGRVAGAPKELALAHWGADGAIGGETRAAIHALQRWRRIAGVPGVVRAAEAGELLAILGEHGPPDLFAAPPAISLPSPEVFEALHGGEAYPAPGDGFVVPPVGGPLEATPFVQGHIQAPPPAPPTPTPPTTHPTPPTTHPGERPTPPVFTGEPLSRAVKRIIEIARGLAEAAEEPFTIRVGGQTYSYLASHFGVEPAFTGLLKAPGGVAYSVRPAHNYWKCNIFGGTVLALAEVPVPTHSVGRFRHFPRAERFGDALARSRGWKKIFHLDHRDPANTEQALVGEAQNEAIKAMLAAIRPGDVFFADNPGPPGSDGGHTRICIEPAAAGDADVAPLFAQARYPSAMLQRDGMTRVAFGRQIQFWVLRYVG